MDAFFDPASQADLLRRAIVAWHAAGSLEQPSPKHSGLQDVDGLPYVCLRAGAKLLACYRVRIVGGKPMLKRLKRLPAGVM